MRCTKIEVFISTFYVNMWKYCLDALRVECVDVFFYGDEGSAGVTEVVGYYCEQFAVYEQGFVQAFCEELVMVVYDILEVFYFG